MNKKLNKIISNIVLILIVLIILYLFFGGSDNNKKDTSSKIKVSVLEKEDILNQSYKSQLSEKIDSFENSIDNITLIQNIKDDLNNKLISLITVSNPEAKLEIINDFEKSLKKYETHLDKEYIEKTTATIEEIKSQINTVGSDLGLNSFNFENYNNKNMDNSNLNSHLYPNNQNQPYNDNNPYINNNINDNNNFNNTPKEEEEVLPIVDLNKSYLLDIKPGESIKVRDKNTLEIVVLTSIKQDSITPTEDMEKKEEESNKKDLILPAGSFVSANLISGLIAPTSLQGINNPVPALFKIYGNAKMPNEKYMDLSGCFILAESRANLSSETVSFRLKTLTCTKDDGDVIEKNVDGYITGENGMEGMAGRVVSKQGALLARAFLGEFASGIGDTIENSGTISSITGGGIINQVNPNKALQTSIAKGFGNSFNTLGNFYKSMAKEMVPVIEINAGRQVNIIFTNSINLGSRVTSNQINSFDTSKNIDFTPGQEHIYYDEKTKPNNKKSSGFLDLEREDINNFIKNNTPITY